MRHGEMVEYTGMWGGARSGYGHLTNDQAVNQGREMVRLVLNRVVVTVGDDMRN